mmetsp:Transcript_1661/g.2455  ORF Transcript_1661/g.2455 Transcript_1661/m.2455 type:complete len:83 (+) Transcript_1661:47-295(+)
MAHPSMRLSANGDLIDPQGEWEDAPAQAAKLWQVLKECTPVLGANETFKRISIVFQGHEFVVAGKPGGKEVEYHVVRRPRAA